MNVYEITFRTVPMTEAEVRSLAKTTMKAAYGAFESGRIQVEEPMPILRMVEEIKP